MPLSIVLIILALIFIFFAIKYFCGAAGHQATPPVIRTIDVDIGNGRHFNLTMQFESQDGFIAGNPIKMKFRTDIVKGVSGVELNLIGAQKYYPIDFDIDNIEEQTNQVTADITANIVSSTKHVIGGDAALYENQAGIVRPYTYLEPDYFTGEKEDLIYPSGGNYSVGVTVYTTTDGKNIQQIGYNNDHDKNYLYENILSISPPETRLAIQTNAYIVGLTLITIAIPLLLEGLKGLGLLTL